MKLKPLHDRVVVRQTEEEATSSGGIILTSAAQEKPSQGEVVAVGTGRMLESGDILPMSISVGDTVIYGKFGGNEVKIDGETFLILSEGYIYGIFE